MLCRHSWLLTIYLALLYHVSFAQEPLVEVTRFNNLPLELTYFEDSTVCTSQRVYEIQITEGMIGCNLP